MTKGRGRHVQFTVGSKVVACGEDNTCETLDKGKWKQSYKLQKERRHSAVWTTDDSTFIIGGVSSEKSTERIFDNGTVVEGFKLRHRTRLNYFIKFNTKKPSVYVCVHHRH